MLDQKIITRLKMKDPTLWSDDAETKLKIINRLGWLNIADQMIENVSEIEKFAREIKEDKFEHVVILGMGGSSLAAEVFAKTFEPANGYPDLTVLDTVDPITVFRATYKSDLEHTLFIVSTKSGSTIETMSLFRHFYERLDRRGEHFVAITDPNSALEKIAEESNFRKIFLNPVDIGGRYSALSYFGLVPAALIGVEIGEILKRSKSVDWHTSAELGSELARHALAGRDKMTLIISPEVETFGVWIEQLIAESTGKEGKGILPVEGETLGETKVYGRDRVFVHIRLDNTMDSEMRALKAAGFPVIRIELNDIYDLGSEFFRWQIATAIAGSVMKLNPFDEPNVAESKKATLEILRSFPESYKLPEEKLIVSEDRTEVYWDLRTASSLGSQESVGDCLEAFLKLSRPEIDYVAMMVFLPTKNPSLQSIRMRIRDHFRVATTMGYGPRFLHSTGQLHKGGQNNGMFIQVTADDIEDLNIPGMPYSFGSLKIAQSLGDSRALRDKDRRLMRIHIADDDDDGGLYNLESEKKKNPLHDLDDEMAKV